MVIAEQLKKSPWGVATTVLFVLAILAYGLSTRPAGAPLPLYVPLAILALATTVIWFAYAFSGEAIERRGDQVRFAYFFVIASFAILVLPVFLKNPVLGTEPLGVVSGCVLNTDIDELRCNPPQQNGAPAASQNNQWLVNIGGALAPQSPCAAGTECRPGSPSQRASITGGLVVPLSVVVIALFGAAVSLSRRVPEIQKRSDPAYTGTVDEPALTMTEAREYLAFQIMQFISAPLIAIVAHQVVRPENTASAIALAFTAGFGSESILLVIRGVANGIKPKTTAAPLAERVGAVKGVITAQGKAVAAEVIVQGTTLKIRSDAQGRYTIAQVPGGIQILSVFKDNTLQARDVSVMPGAQTTCDIDIAGNGHASAPGLLSGAASERDAAAIDEPVTVAIRVAIEMDALDPGTLGMEVDGQAVSVDSHGMVELALLPDVPHRIVAGATSGGAAVTGELNITVGLDDEGYSYSLDLQ